MDFRMDVKSLSELLKGTIDPTVRNEAEKKLAEVHKIIGFGPVLLQVLLYPPLPCHHDHPQNKVHSYFLNSTTNQLQVVMSNEVELPVRQAAVIYLKNMVSFQSHSQDSSFCLKAY